MFSNEDNRSDLSEVFVEAQLRRAIARPELTQSRVTHLHSEHR